jgi:RNA polymerase sigma-70 factor (ECF subfamily)
MGRLRKSDENALRELMDKYNRFLFGIVGMILTNIGTNEDIEECVSDVWIALWQKPSLYDVKRGTLKSFVAVMARSKAIDRYRALSSKTSKPLKDDETDSLPDPLSMILLKADFRQVRSAVNTLEEPDREIVIRRYFVDETPLMISKNMKCPVKEVHNRLYRTKEKLKNILKNDGSEGYYE